MTGNELYHYGILGQKWGIRRYQNPDGTLTEAGKRRLAKKDDKWIKKKSAKIQADAEKKSAKEMSKYVRKELNPKYNGQVGRRYMLEYNQKLAQVMNTKVKDISSPSGQAVQFIAKRGEFGVHMALTSQGYDKSSLNRSGVYDSGRKAYKQDYVERR